MKIKIRVNDVMYDTVKCTAFLTYDTDGKEIIDVYLMSNFCYTKDSSVVWEDLVQYGACVHTCTKQETEALLDCIKDKEWESDLNDKAVNLKEEVLNR